MKSKNQKRRPSRQKKRPEANFHNVLRQGTQALHQGKIGTATELLEHAHQMEPENGDVVLNLSGAYILSKKFKQAVTLLEPLSEREPENPMIWTNLGAAYLGNPILAGDDKQQKAIAAFERAIGLDPKAPNVAYNIGLVYYDRKDYNQAQHWFQQALEVNPNDKDAQLYLERLKNGDESA